jgi:cytochrome b subunit of formate dehydrogenase
MMVVFVFLLTSVLFWKPGLLRLGKRLCHLILACCGIAVVVGGVGLFSQSVTLAWWLPIGVDYAFVTAVFLAGIQEARRIDGT